jgi:NitT/TauT family transport system permease protein
VTGLRIGWGRVRRGAIGIVALLALAEAAGRLGLISDTVPLTSQVLVRAVTLLGDPDFLLAIAKTLWGAALGLLLCVVVMIPLGVLLGTFAKVERALRPVIEFMRPIPSIALIPLAIMVFGGAFSVKVAIVVYACTWPILFNTMHAVQDVDPLAKMTMRSFGFGGAAVLRFVLLPSAAPFILTGIRLSAAVAIIVGVSTELFTTGAEGIGAYLTVAQSSGGLDGTAVLIAVAVWSGVIGMAVNGLFVYAGDRMFRWHRPSGKEVT